MTEDLGRGEDGVALVTALLAVVILAGMSAVFMNRAIVETRASGHSQRWESTIHSVEAAADQQIVAMNANGNYVTDLGAGIGVPALTEEELDDASWLTDLLDDETRLNTIRGSEAFVSDEQGEAVAVRPAIAGSDPVEGWDVIVAVGATPSFDATNAEVRTLRLQLARDRFRPEHALLTNGPLNIGGNGAIMHPDCDTDDPSSCIADVHTNQSATFNGNPLIQGQLTVTDGSCPSGTEEPGNNKVNNGCKSEGIGPQPIPPYTARSQYNKGLDDVNPDPGGQTVEGWDLCRGGKVYRTQGSIPCTGSVEWTSGGGNSTFQGWRWQAGKWQASSLQAGVYYVYDADAEITGTEDNAARSVSVIVESDNHTSDAGTLVVRGNPRLSAALSGVLFITDRDLNLRGTGGGGAGTSAEVVCARDDAMSGFIGVGEQLRVGGNYRMKGSIVVRDDPSQHNEVTASNRGISGNMCLEFDDELTVDLAGYWVVTFWNEV